MLGLRARRRTRPTRSTSPWSSCIRCSSANARCRRIDVSLRRSRRRRGARRRRATWSIGFGPPHGDPRVAPRSRRRARAARSPSRCPGDDARFAVGAAGADPHVHQELIEISATRSTRACTCFSSTPRSITSRRLGVFSIRFSARTGAPPAALVDDVAGSIVPKARDAERVARARRGRRRVGAIAAAVARCRRARRGRAAALSETAVRRPTRPIGRSTAWAAGRAARRSRRFRWPPSPRCSPRSPTTSAAS